MNYAASSCLGVIRILKICSMYQDLNFWRTPTDARPLSIGAKDKGEQKGVSPYIFVLEATVRVSQVSQVLSRPYSTISILGLNLYYQFQP